MSEHTYLAEARFSLTTTDLTLRISTVHYCTLIKKGYEILLIYKKSQMRSAIAKSYMRKGFGFLMEEEMRKYLTIYEEAVSQ